MRAAILDTETTDLITNSVISDKHQPRITEFYAVLTDDTEKELAELEFLCNPGVDIPEIVTKITGIDDALVADEPAFPEFIEKVRSFIEGSDAVVAHNVSYDHDVINMEFERAGVQPIKWPRLICTVEETEWMMGYRLNLQALHVELFHEQFASAHRARADTQALKRCYHELRRRGYL